MNRAQQATLAWINHELIELANNEKHLTQAAALKRVVVDDPATGDEEREYYQRSLEATEEQLARIAVNLTEWTALHTQLQAMFAVEAAFPVAEMAKRTVNDS